MVAVAGFKTGLAVAANLSIGGFDTHGNHDGGHIPLMGNLLAGIDLVWTEITNAGLAGKVVIAVGSDSVSYTHLNRHRLDKIRHKRTAGSVC